MTTQYERDMIAREARTRKLHALVYAATVALEHLPPHGAARADLLRALEPYSLRDLNRDVADADKRAAERRAAEEALAGARRAFEELPDAPPRLQCEAEVSHVLGLMIDFDRCGNEAKRIILDPEARRERAVCVIHARKVLEDGKPQFGWYDATYRGDQRTHTSWYRMKGWCMERVGDRYCKVRVEVGTGLHPGKAHR